MKTPRIINFERIENYLIDSLAPKMDFLFTHKPGNSGHNVTHFGLYFISILSLVACQPSLWGAPPPPPTFVAPTASATFQIPTLAPTITPMPPTAVPTPVVLNAAQVWASPATPLALRNKFQSWGFQVLATEQASANLYIDVAQTRLLKHATISSSNMHYLMFNTGLFHAVVPEPRETGSWRLIYSFAHDFQVAQFVSEQPLIEAYRQRRV